MNQRVIDIPEVRDLHVRRQLVRIPPQIDVPLTERVRNLIDTASFRRLARISQLGLVSLVYPAAHHSRFEHSLGVYRNALLYLHQLGIDPRFHLVVTNHEAETLIVAALLHDIGHWPYCHPIEDLRLKGVPRHEQYADEFIQQDEVASVLREQWDIAPEEVTTLLSGSGNSGHAASLLRSLLSGPVDIDKMDYLGRDSLHAGVPYGRNFDQARLIGSLCLNEAGDALAITEKGRTAAEMMVFARYVMFSEVYWHHAVRSATAMVQRAFYELRHQMDVSELFRRDEQQFKDDLLLRSAATPAASLTQGLWGPRRELFKRAEQYSLFQSPELYNQLARRPYPWLVSCASCLAEQLSRVIGRPIDSAHVLLDAPPIKREIEIDIDVFFPKEARYRSLTEVSPVVQTLAKKQFDDYVKRVRVYLAPDVSRALRDRHFDVSELLAKSIEQADREHHAEAD